MTDSELLEAILNGVAKGFALILILSIIAFLRFCYAKATTKRPPSKEKAVDPAEPNQRS